LRERTETAAATRPPSRWMLVASIGPGILVMLADTDAGNVVTAAQSGAQWGYRLLPLLLGLIPVLYMVQELTLRLGIFTGGGYGELVRRRFGAGRAWVLVAGLVVRLNLSSVSSIGFRVI
jgi:Mn2+/Fe2+ NRAMP family transporter